MVKINRERYIILTSGYTHTHRCETVYTHIHHTHPKNEKNIHHTFSWFRTRHSQMSNDITRYN